MNLHSPLEDGSFLPEDIELSDIFIGREDQLDLFRIYLERWQRLIVGAPLQELEAPPSPNDKIQGFVALLHGRGGLGKSTLLKHYREIALEYSSTIQVSHLIDWEFAARDRRALFNPAEREEIDFTQYFNFMCEQLAKALNKKLADFKEYQSAVIAVEDARRQAKGILEVLQREEGHTWLGALTGEGILSLMRTIPYGSLALTNDVVTNAIRDATDQDDNIGIEKIKQVWSVLQDRIGNQLRDYLDAPWQLGKGIGHDLAQMAQRRPILIFFDTYEEIDEGDKLLQMIMGAAGRNVGWVIAGRDNLWAGMEQRHRSLEMEYGYKDLVLADRRMVVDFSADGVGDFTSSDIEEFFIKLRQKARRATLPTIDTKEAERIRDVTYGVPLAVRIAAGLYLESESFEVITESLDARREIVDQMVRRYLLHTRTNRADKARLYGLALLRRPDEQRALTAALNISDSEYYDAELSRLHRRYSFIFNKQEKPALHQEVRHFLRFWLLQNRSTSPEIKQVIQRILEALLTSFDELEAQRNYTSLRERLKDEQWVELYLDLTEQAFWLDSVEGLSYILPFNFAASVYHRGANREARSIGEFFQETLIQPYRRHWDWANESLVYNTSRNPLTEELSGLKDLARFASQTAVAFPPSMPPFTEELEAALWWRLAEAYQGKDSDGSAYWYKKALDRLPDEIELRKAFAEALWDKEHESVNEERKPTTSYLLEEQTQSAPEKPFYRNMWESIKRTLPKSSQTPPDLLISEVNRFFVAAGFRHLTTIGPTDFLYQPVIPIWQKKIKHDVYIQISSGQSLDGDDVLRIRGAIQKRLEDISLVFVVVDKPIEDNAWLHIAALRTKNINVIPIPSTLLFESQTIGKANTADIVLDKHLERFIGQGVDPYNIRHPVFDELNFFGREALALNLVEQIASGQPMGLFGLRKIGKSSLMRYVQRLMPCPTARLDLQAGAEPLGLYERILRAWNNDALTRFRVDLNLGDFGLNSEEPNTEFVKITQQILDKLSLKKQEARLAIFLDEIELFVPPLDAVGPLLEKYLSLMRTLRGLVQEDGRVFLMVAGIDPAINRVSRWGNEQKQNPFFMLLQEFYLPPLPESDCIQMIRNIGTQVELSYSDEAASNIAWASGGHPSLARQLCSLAYRQHRQRPGEVTLRAIQKATERFLSDPQYAASLNETGLWGEVTNSRLWGEQAARANQRILFILAQSTDSQKESVITNGPDPIAGRSALFALSELHVIRPIDESLDAADSHYTITFGLLRAWIRHMRLGLEE